MEQDLRELLEREYDVGHLESLEQLKDGVSNTNYRVHTSSGEYVVRVCRYEPENQVRVMLPFLVYASTHNVPAPKLVRTRSGDTHTQLHGAPVVVTTFVPGETARPRELSATHISRFAESLAQLHGCGWEPAENSTTLHPSFILGVYDTYKATRIPEEMNAPDGFETMLQEDHEHFSAPAFLNAFETLPQYVVHGDLLPGNVMYGHDGHVAAFLDLEEIGRATRLLDLARVIIRWFFVKDAYDATQLSNFMHAYHNILPLSAEERAQFGEVFHYVAFRHAVFMLKMVAQERVTSFVGNEDVPQYLDVRQHGAPVWATN